MSRPVASLLLVALALSLATGCTRSPSMAKLPKATKPLQTAVSSVAGGQTGAATGGGWVTAFGASEPAVAPSGDRLAFRVAGRGIFTANTDGRNAVAVPGSTADDREPAWSETGDAIAAIRAEAGGMTALVRFPAGGRAERLYAGQGALATPAFVPGSGAWLVVESTGRSARLLRVARGGVATPLLEAALLASPTVAPDGRSAIVERRGASGGSELARVDLVAGAATPLHVDGKNPRRPALDPAGRRLAYLADEGLWIADASGAAGHLVSKDRGFGVLAWRAQGTDLLASAKEGSRSDLVRVAP